MLRLELVRFIFLLSNCKMGQLPIQYRCVVFWWCAAKWNHYVLVFSLFLDEILVIVVLLINVVLCNLTLGK